MKDSKKKSFVEALFDVIVGFLLYLPVNFFVLPYFTHGINDYNVITMLSISSMYTSIALVRKYAIRRWFISLKHKHTKKKLIEFQTNVFKGLFTK